MTLVLESRKNLTEKEIVVNITKKVSSNPSLFIYISRVFANYKDNQVHMREEIFSFIKGVFEHPKAKSKLALPKVDIENIIQLLNDVYLLNNKQFAKVRGQILENVVFHFGAYRNGLNGKYCFHEPKILDTFNKEEYIVGESDNKCDLVYFSNVNIPLEFVECKAEITNVIPRTLPFSGAKKEHQDKIIYLDKSYRYLKTKYLEPNIIFACYNSNYTESLMNIRDNWGYSYVSFINPEEIIS